MNAFDIVVKNKNSAYKELANDCSAYVYFLERTGQVLKREHMIIEHENTVRIPVLSPEIEAFNAENSTDYALEIRKKIEKQSRTNIQYVQTGKDEDNFPNYQIPQHSSFYILYYGQSSPLLCGDTLKGIPLYKIPYTAHNNMDYDNINFWQNDYERLYGLWLGIYEEFATKELQEVDSEINKIGRELCSIIEKKTGVPTYYFLFNYRSWSKEEDARRKCPLTGNNWKIKGATVDDLIAFKCEKSRLVSELSHNCSEK